MEREQEEQEEQDGMHFSLRSSFKILLRHHVGGQGTPSSYVEAACCTSSSGIPRIYSSAIARCAFLSTYTI